MRKKVTVLMAVYNGEATVSSAIDSVLSQNFNDFDLLIVNDCSTDSTGEILRKYQSKYPDEIKVIENKNNLKLAGSLNHGIKFIESDYIARMDADDEMLPNRLKLQADFLDDHPEIAVVGGSFIGIDRYGNEVGVFSRPKTHNELCKIMYKQVPFYHPTVMMRSDFIRKMGGYDQKWRRCEDAELWLRSYKKYKFANIKDVVLRYRMPQDFFWKNTREISRMLIAKGRENGECLKAYWAVFRILGATLLAKLNIHRSKYQG